MRCFCVAGAGDVGTGRVCGAARFGGVPVWGWLGLLRDWKSRWQAAVQDKPRWRHFALPGAFDDRPPGGGLSSRSSPGPASPHAQQGRKKKRKKGHPHLALYEHSAKAYGSLICQARTGKIGLREFLFLCRVPDVASPMCPCGIDNHNVTHLLTTCVDDRSAPLRALGYSSEAAVTAGLRQRSTVLGIARGLLHSGWLPQFRLFSEIRRYFGQDDNELGRAWRARTRPP